MLGGGGAGKCSDAGDIGLETFRRGMDWPAVSEIDRRYNGILGIKKRVAQKEHMCYIIRNKCSGGG